MIENSSKKREIKPAFLILLLISFGGIAFLLTFTISQKNIQKDLASDNANININSNSAEEDNGNINSPISNENINSGSPTISSDDQTAADDYYKQGIDYFNQKNYQEAINQLTKAIALSKSADYYSKKSQAEKNLGQDQQAIKTIEDGLKYNPDSDLLKTRLDILQKQWLGSQQQ